MKYRLYGFHENKWMEYGVYKDISALVDTANLLGQQGFKVKVEVVG